MKNAVKYVPHSQLISTGFNQDHLEVHRKLITKVDMHPPGNKFSQEPWRYLNDEFNYLGDDIVPLDNVRVADADKSSGKSAGVVIYQKPRSGGNPQHPAISESITNDGYDLKSIPIAVNKRQDDDGVYYELLDGRTRWQILSKMKVTNVLVDIFDVAEPDQQLLFGSQANNAELKSGVATKEDIVNVIQNLILLKSSLVKLPFPIKSIVKKGFENQLIDRHKKIATILEEAINNVSLGSINDSDVRWIVNKVIEADQDNPLVLTFPAGKGVNPYIEDNFNINIDNDSHNTYLVTSTGSEGKVGYILQGVIAKINDHPDKTANIILFDGNPGHNDPEGKWLKATQIFIGEINQFFEDIGEMMFDGQKIDMSRVKVLGAVPQIRSLAKDFPMDKLVTPSDFNKSKYPIKNTKAVILRNEQEEQVLKEELKVLRESFQKHYTEAAG